MGSTDLSPSKGSGHVMRLHGSAAAGECPDEGSRGWRCGTLKNGCTWRLQLFEVLDALLGDVALRDLAGHPVG
jgi:hypothetical protein